MTTKKRGGWRRTDSNPDTDPAFVLRELQRRQMRDLDTCRDVWQREGDPFAVLEAVRQSNLPDWLTSAIVVLATDGECDWPALRARQFRERFRAAIDRERAFQISGVRSETDATWEQSFSVGDALTRKQFDDMPSATSAGLKRAYERVSKGLREFSHRYYVPMPGFRDFVLKAWARQLETMRESLLNR